MLHIRLTENLHSWLRQKAARETIKQDKYVSQSALVRDLLTEAMQADQREEDTHGRFARMLKPKVPEETKS